MGLERIGAPLVLMDLPDQLPGSGEIRMQVGACGVIPSIVKGGQSGHPGPSRLWRGHWQEAPGDHGH